MDQAVKNAQTLRDLMAERIRNLKAQLTELQKNIAIEEGRLQEVNAFIHVHSQYEALEFPGLEAPVPQVASRGASQKRPQNPDRRVVADAAYAIIERHGSPMSRTALFGALEASGFSIEGKDPEMVLSTMLWRSKDKLIRLDGHGYWMLDKPYPPAGYVPHSSVFD